MPSADAARSAVQLWIDDARHRLAAGRPPTAGDLDALEQAAAGGSAASSQPASVRRQRLLYLHATTPTIHARLAGAAMHEPVAGVRSEINPASDELPYNTVFEAILDGWRVIHFPQQLAPFEDREIDIIGYEFVLEKLDWYQTPAASTSPASAAGKENA